MYISNDLFVSYADLYIYVVEGARHGPLYRDAGFLCAALGQWVSGSTVIFLCHFMVNRRSACYLISASFIECSSLCITEFAAAADDGRPRSDGSKDRLYIQDELLNQKNKNKTKLTHLHKHIKNISSIQLRDSFNLKKFFRISPVLTYFNI